MYEITLTEYLEGHLWLYIYIMKINRALNKYLSFQLKKLKKNVFDSNQAEEM